jgi:hypothetical protein
VSGDEVSVLILAAFVLHAYTRLAPGLVDIISRFSDYAVTLARVFWNNPMGFEMDKSLNREIETYGHESPGTKKQE